jgi:hypothetical protein
LRLRKPSFERFVHPATFLSIVLSADFSVAVYFFEPAQSLPNFGGNISAA